MRRFVMVGAVIAVGLGMWGCGGGYSSSNAGNPNSPTPPSTAGVVTVNVVAINGAQSFSPNPATLPAAQMIVWHNVDNRKRYACRPSRRRRGKHQMRRVWSVRGGSAPATQHFESDLLEKTAGVGGQDRAREERR